MNIVELATPGVQKLRPYEPGKPVEELERELGITDIVKLASNENPLGASKAAKAVLHASIDLARYPDGGGHTLKQALAAHTAVPAANITLGNGSNDILEMLARVFLREGLNAVCSAHAFAVYPLATIAAGGELREVPALPAGHEQAYGHDLDAFADHVDANTRLVFIANPNNPTGTWCEPAAIERLLDRLPEHVIVVLDEAYREYQDESLRPDATGLLGRYPNLVVTRTFSKAYGLAALRVGYALSSPAVADLLNRVRQPFNNNELALRVAVAALADQDHVAASVALNREQMNWLTAELKALGLSCLPSQANFLCVDLAGRDGQALFKQLLHKGVIVRPVGGYKLPGHVRVTIGTAPENQRFIAALKELL